MRHPNTYTVLHALEQNGKVGSNNPEAVTIDHGMREEAKGRLHFTCHMSFKGDLLRFLSLHQNDLQREDDGMLASVPFRNKCLDP